MLMLLCYQLDDLNMNSRPMNGPEDAQDYLWLTQDLWMESDVWNWADQDAKIKATVQRMCCSDSCGKIETRVAEYKRCAACKTVCPPIVQGRAMHSSRLR